MPTTQNAQIKHATFHIQRPPHDQNVYKITSMVLCNIFFFLAENLDVDPSSVH